MKLGMRRRSCWLAHGLVACCAAALLGGMALITRGTLSAERERLVAESRAVEQENIRLALWRMDAAATAWIADEAQRPVISPPSKEAPKPEVKLRFECREDGSTVADPPDLLAELTRRMLPLPDGAPLFPSLCGAMPDLPSAWSAPPVDQVAIDRGSQAYQVQANGNEFAKRGQVVKSALDASNLQYEDKLFLQNSAAVPATWNIAPDWNLARSGLPRPAWIGGELFLLRHLQWERPDGTALRSIQGSWLDAGKLQTMLLAEVADLFPAGRLVPASGADDAGLALASLPWRFDPQLAGLPPGFVLPRAVVLPLVAGWAAAIVAIAAVWLLVGALIRLSEKRAAFVSAVTHELRTPLTTFQLYSEMLESGAVKEQRRGEYFRTLRREAERLSHLVENVLAFSRIERGSARAVLREIAARDLVRPMSDRFAERLAEVGMKWQADFGEPAWNGIVRTDAAAVEHVLFNLIDNAAKYAAAGGEVAMKAEVSGDKLAILVCDRGPGIAPRESRRVFHAFHKSAAAAAESRPGVGLGLALSRRLARDCGGELSLRTTASGCCFVLSLPRVG
jgi:signal transduction histidine kinase